jgi:hypothetical protein
MYGFGDVAPYYGSYGGWGWDWGLWLYNNSGGGNATVVAIPHATSQRQT